MAVGVIILIIVGVSSFRGNVPGKSTTANTTVIASDDDFEVSEILLKDVAYSRCFLTVKNNSNETVDIAASLTAKDSSGREIESSGDYLSALGPGEEYIIRCTFANTSDVDKVDYELDYKKAENYDPIISDLQKNYYNNDSNVVLSVTNTGTKAGHNI